METKTRFVFLMHPKEFKREKAGTGRLTHVCLPQSEIHMGIEFDHHEAVQSLIRDPANYTVLLYPGEEARNLSTGEISPEELSNRRLVILLLDATWSGARKMLRLSPSLQRLPRIMFNSGSKSRYVIKQQPQDGCLSTLEATHEVLVALESAGLDRYPLPDQLLNIFKRMQDFQIDCARDPERAGYRRHPYSAPGDRSVPTGRSGARRLRYLGKSVASVPVAEPKPPNDSGSVSA